MSLSTSPRSIQCVLVSSRSSSRPRRGGVKRPFALPIRSNAVGLSSAKSVGMQSRVEPMFAIEP